MISAATNKSAMTISHRNLKAAEMTTTVTMRREGQCMSQELFHRVDSCSISINNNQQRRTRKIEETRIAFTMAQARLSGKGTDLLKKSRGKRRRSMSVTCKTLQGSSNSAKKVLSGPRPKTSCKMVQRRSPAPFKTRPILPC